MNGQNKSLRTRVGKYEFGRVLGEGSFGKVHLSRNLETGEKRAIKVLSKDRVMKNKMTEQIKREIFTMKLLNHPNVVQLYEVMANRKKIYFVMEYVTGGELYNRIAKHGKLKEEDARKYFQQLINAIDYCHKEGIYHRDLKLENLLLDRDGNLKISDFGLSALSQQAREDGLLYTTCGTPSYVAPEVIIDKGYDGSKADIWSCGIVLFVLLAGYLPFDDPNIMNLYKKICKADFRCPEWFSSEVRTLIVKLLDPNPTNRIGIAQILQSSWFKRGYKPTQFKESSTVDSGDVDFLFGNQSDYTIKKSQELKPLTLNAFDIISLSKGLNLSGLFEKDQGVRQEMRVALSCSSSEIMVKMEEYAKSLGFNAKRRDFKMKLEKNISGKKGHLLVFMEVFEVSEFLFVVELKKARGDTIDFDQFYQNYLSAFKETLCTSDTKPTVQMVE